MKGEFGPADDRSTGGPADLVDRLAGALLGTAVGDALGAPLEGRRWVTEAYLDNLDEEPGSLTYTDDTHMALGVAQSLLAVGGFDGEAMAKTLAANFAAEPWRGYGAGPAEIFGALERGERWDEVASRLFGGGGSFGNGGAMRVAPVALAGYPELDRIAELAAATARITHTHPEGVDGAVAQAVAIGWLLLSDPQIPLVPGDLLAVVADHLDTGVFEEKLAEVERALSDPDPRRAGRRLGNGIEARRSVPTALYCFLSMPGSFPAAVKLALSLGGDTDTIASMTGALVGARLGASSIPERWREVEGGEVLLDYARAFLQGVRTG